MLNPSSPPSWLRAASLRWVDASGQYYGLARARGVGEGGGLPRVPEWSEAWSDVVHSQRTLQGLRDAGITAITIHFDHGFGLKAQAREIEHATEFAALCHAYGLRVFAYIEAGALFHETLLAEHPGVAAWAQRDAQGVVIPIGPGRPAWRPCYLSSGFLGLLKESISVACEGVNADGVYLANVGPHLCHCERCQETFRRLLASHHPDPRRTLGLPTLAHVRLPEFAAPGDPLAVEAAYFRVYALRSALAEARIHLRSVSAHVALWARPRVSAEGIAMGSAALWELSAAADILTCDAPAGCDDGGENTQPFVHPFLAGNATRTIICLGSPGHGGRQSPASPADVVARSQAALGFGGHVLAWEGALRGADLPESAQPAFLSGSEAREAWEHCVRFAARHEHYFHGARSMAEVAVAFSVTDIAATPDELQSARRAEQALLKASIPFDVLPIESVASGEHRVVVLAGQRRMTDEEGAVLVALARAGRALVLVGEIGTQDRAGRQRRQGALAPVLSLPAVRQVRPSSEGSGLEPIGRVVRELLQPNPVVEVVRPRGAGPGVVVHPFRLPTRQAAFHLLNTGGRVVEGLRLRIRGDLAPTRHVAWHGPEASDQMLGCAAEGGLIVTALPALRAYALVVTS